LEWLERSDFYFAPASTKYHGNYEEQLLQHSLNVYDCYCRILGNHPEIEITEESKAINALFHDVCKANLYKKGFRNVKDDETGQWYKKEIYETDDRLPLGHGEKSVIILQSFMTLTRDEIYSIRWHMGAFDKSFMGGDYGLDNAFEICPAAVCLHLADMEASLLMEDKK
jgi:HD superfamily phosphohydrolase YqeK